MSKKSRDTDDSLPVEPTSGPSVGLPNDPRFGMQAPPLPTSKPWYPDEPIDPIQQANDEPTPCEDRDLLLFAIRDGRGQEVRSVGPYSLQDIFGVPAGRTQEAMNRLANVMYPCKSEYSKSEYSVSTVVNWIVNERIPVRIDVDVRRRFSALRQQELERPAREAAEQAAAKARRRDAAAFYASHKATLELLARLAADGLLPAQALDLARTAG